MLPSSRYVQVGYAPSRGRTARVATTAAAFVLLGVLAWVQGYRATHNTGADMRGYVAAAEALLHRGFLGDTWVNSWPPFFALFMVPVAWLWRAIPEVMPRLLVVYCANLTLTVLYVVVSVRAVSGPGQRARPLRYALVAFCALPFLRSNLWFHQINVVISLFCVIAFRRLASRQNDTVAGVLIGLAASVKVQPALLVPWFVGRWRAFLAAAATGLVCAIAPAFVYGVPTWIEAWRFWIVRAIPAHTGAHGISLSALLHNFFDRSAGGSLQWIDLGSTSCQIVGTVLGFGILCLLYVSIFRRRRKGPEQVPILDLAQLMPVSILAGVLAWKYHLVALVPAFAALLSYLAGADGESRRLKVVWVLFAVSLLLAYSIELEPYAELDRFFRSWGASTWSAYLAVFALEIARRDRCSTAFAPNGRPAHASPSS